MKPRRLPHRITIQRPIETKNQYKISQVDWEDYVSLFASVEPISGREYVLLQNTKSELTVRIKIYYYPGVTSAMRVVYGSRVLNIESVINYKELNREMHLMCVEGEP